MEAVQNTPISLESPEPLFTTKKGVEPFWDHPRLKAIKILPKNYYPYTTQDGVIGLIKNRIIDQDDVTLLKVLGDAICANEDQLRRYLSPKASRSETSKRLDRFRKMGLADRWKVRIRDKEEIDDLKPPAPFTLGVGGFKLLNHYYNGQPFMNPGRWDEYGVGGIKRYVAMNELRCQMTEKKICKTWKWSAIIANDRRIKFPMAAAEIATPQGNLNFLIDRIQMNQNFIGFLQSRLMQWKELYNQHGNIPVSDFPDNMAIVIVYTATLSLANYAHEKLMFDTYPFPIWLCVEEDLLEEGFNTAFYRPDGETLKRMIMEF